MAWEMSPCLSSMKISVHVTSNATQNTVEKISEADYKVRVTAPPIEGKANIAVAKLLADYFGVSKSQVELIHGHKSRIKYFEIH